MAQEKIPAEGWTFEIDTDGVPTWVAIENVKSHSWSPTKRDADTTDYDSGGWEEHYASRRGLSLTIEVNLTEDDGDGALPTGQQAALDLAQATGLSSKKPLRVTSPGGRTLTGDASADMRPGDGREGDNTTTQIVFKFSGQPTWA